MPSGRTGRSGGAPRSARSQRSQMSRAKSTSSIRPSEDFAPITDMRATGYLPEVGRFAVTGIPGYAGYVPGKYPENVMGATHQRTNELSIAACDARAFPEETGAVQSGRSAHARRVQRSGVHRLHSRQIRG